MEDKANLERKTLLVGQFTDYATYTLMTNYLPHLNTKLTRHPHAIDAARSIKSEKFPLILLPVRLTIGSGIENHKDLDELRKIWYSGLSQHEKYFRTSLQLAKYAREELNPNKDSLIIFTDSFLENNDSYIPNIQKRVLEAKGDEYINLISTKPEKNNRLFSLIDKKLGWKASFD